MNNRIIISLFILLTMISFSCNNRNTNSKTISLNGDWGFRSIEEMKWMPATVPGTVHTDLMANNIIEDPFYRMNEHEIQWIDKTDWEYIKNFNVDRDFLAHDKVEIQFDGLDTWATIFINDSLVATTDNMFITWRIDCKKYLKDGENTIRVLFGSPINIGLEKRDNLGFQLPGAENDQSELGGLGDKKVCVFSRKAQYHFGWDWGPRLVSSGIWKDVVLSAWNDARICDMQVYQDSLSEDVATLNIEAEIESLTDGSFSLVTLIDNNISDAREVILKKGLNDISFNIDILYPELWWPNGIGDQRLYDIEIELKDNLNIISTDNREIGLRTVKLIREPDSIGASFYFEVNGHPVFMKGANYIPQDVFLNRPTDGDYAFLIRSAKEANFNMLRVWGGGIYEKDIFYELCDQAGILVWQDFMFACAMYPGDDNFLKSVENEAIQNIKRLRNHPSIALWCGENEILSAWNRWGWKDKVLEEQGQNIFDTIWSAYDTLFHKLLPSVVKKYDPDRVYWSSSPSADIGELENGKSGDNHYWGVWWGKEPFSSYDTNIPRFMSEFGFQSFPKFSSVKNYTSEEDWDIYSAVMKSHQRSSIGNVTIGEYLKRDYKDPKDFEMFLYVGQLLQARGIRIGIEAQRRAMPTCMGSLYWQINDCWPVASWSSIDYYGRWKALHYSVKEAFKETIISTNTNEIGETDIYIVNDKLKDITATLSVFIMDFDGNVLLKEENEIIILANSSNVYLNQNYTDAIREYGKANILIKSTLKLVTGEILDEDISYFTTPKNLNLSNPEINYNISIKNDSLVIEFTSNRLAKNIYISTPENILFSDNYFDLIPGNKKVILVDAIANDTTLTYLESNLNIISLYNSFN